MATYKSKYNELTFYVDGVPRRFNSGRYVTNDRKEIEVLDMLSDATKLAEEKPAKTETKAEVNETPKAPTKAATTRKSSGK